MQDLEADHWLVTLQGEHDVSTVGALRDHLESIFRTGTEVVIDLAPTSFMDSSVLAVLLEFKERADATEEKRFGLVVTPATPPQRLLELTGALRLFDVYGSVEDALDEFDDDDITHSAGGSSANSASSRTNKPSATTTTAASEQKRSHRPMTRS